MNASEFRDLALRLPEATEGAHQGHADFRIRGKVFATLGPDEEWAMVKVAAELQASLVAAAPGAFAPFPGAWGRQGCTRVELARARASTVREALRAAWRRAAPKRLVQEHDRGSD
jgi:hypothetical protein